MIPFSDPCLLRISPICFSKMLMNGVLGVTFDSMGAGMVIKDDFNSEDKLI